MVPYMKSVGEECGIKFSYGGHVGNTFDSHRLIWKAREDGGSDLQDKMVESLFKAYFEDEKSLGEDQVLKECCEEVFGNTSTIMEDSSIGNEEVMQEMEYFRNKYHVRGVPFFVVDGKYELSGAQPSEAFLEIFEQLK
uniref:DSBA-like thioredoxin domain-containing protein n=1 Tax=Helicotheca tamesis TaxID=374047 RepID=A0A7S2GZG4_9STRA|mmetsp:Transcript_13680/g.18785  ORF Transcript_13680/g.18785 Transcript_13680/m.18785 type:complete len:138 (+) Transcript_13680:317-730(+)